MNPLVKSLLNELYSADPALQQHEATLLAVIERMLKGRPNVQVDERFRRELRAKIIAAVADQDRSATTRLGRNWLYALSGIGLFLLVAIPVALTVFWKKGDSGTAGNLINLSGKLAVHRVGEQAFGSLSPDLVSPTVEANRSGATEESKTATGAGQADAAIRPEPDLLYQPTLPVYEYGGEPLTLGDEQLPVYRRVPGFSGTQSAASLLGETDSSLFDFSKIANAEVRNIQLTENRDRGYQYYIDFIDGSIMIDENWERWYSASAAEDLAPLSDSDLPTDSETINLANAFLSTYDIDRSAYGQPEVSKEWMLYATKAVAGDESEVVESPYVPDQLTVTYPLSVDGARVVDQGGLPYGLQVRVGVRERRVLGLNNLRSWKLEQSMYGAIQESSDVLAVLRRGGVYAIEPEAGTETVAYETGTPERVYTLMTGTDQEAGELLVPALSFPITKTPTDGAVYQSAIVVPLIQDFLVSQVPVLLEDQAGQAVPGSAGEEPEEVPTRE